MADFTKLPVAKLKEECRKRNLAVGGVKAVLIKRLEEHENPQQQQSPTPSETPRQTPRLDALKKSTGVGTSPGSLIQDHTAPLKKGDALEIVMLPPKLWTDVQPRTLECVYALQATALLLRRGSQAVTDEGVNDALKPVLKFCQDLAAYTQHTVREEDLSSNRASNMLNLRTHMTERVQEIMNEYPDCFKDTSIQELFGNFHGGPLPDNLAGHTSARNARRGTQQHETMDDDQDEELQRVLMESLVTFNAEKEAAVGALDAMQLAIQQNYLEQGGEVTMEDDSGEGLAEIPPFDQVLEQIPESGITFTELVRSLNIFKHGRDVLQELNNTMFYTATVKEGRLFPPQSEGNSGTDELPTDEKVKETLWSHDKMDMLTLFKVLRVRELGAQKCSQFRDGLFKRGVVVEDENNFLKVAAGDQDNLAGPNPEGPTYLERLPGEMLRIRAAVLAHIRYWKDSFPRPSECAWNELKPEERSSIIRHINAYVGQNDLLDQEDTIDNTINHLLTNDPGFPVAEGKNKKAITAAVKKVYQEHGTKKKKRASRGSMSTAAGDDDGGADPPTGTRAGTPSGTGGGTAPQGAQGGMRRRSNRNKTASGTASQDAARDNDDGDETVETPSARPKRAAGGAATSNKRGREEPEAEEEEMAAPRKVARGRRKNVVIDEEDEDDEFDPDA